MEGLEEIFLTALKDAPTMIILIFFAAWSIKKYVINGLQDAIRQYLQEKIELSQASAQATLEIASIVKQILDIYSAQTKLLQEIAAGVGGRRKED